MIGNTNSTIKSTRTGKDLLEFVYFEKMFGVLKKMSTWMNKNVTTEF